MKKENSEGLKKITRVDEGKVKREEEKEEWEKERKNTQETHWNGE